MRTLRAGVARAVWLLLAGPIAATACRERPSTSPAEAEAEAEPLPSVPDEGFVVLPWGTRVYLEPRFGGASSRLGWPSLPPPPWPPFGHVARVVGQRDGFVEIAPLMPPLDPHCAPLLDGEATLDVRLYVSPWALAPVLARDHEVTLDDGTTLSLRPGALAQPIPGDPSGRSAVAAGGIRVRAVVPDDALALAYAAPRPMPMPMQRGWPLAQDHPFGFDGWPLELDLVFGHDVAIAAVEPRDGAHVVELVSPCARVQAHTERAPVSWESEPIPRFEHGLGGPEAVPASVLALAGVSAPGEPDPEAAVEATNEGEAVDALLSSDVQPAGVVLDMKAIRAIELRPSFHGEVVSSIPGLPAARPELVFEEGAPIYLSPAGPVAGMLAGMRVFTEDGWAVGDRLCFHTAFGSRFAPPLPVCLPADEARLRDPAVDVHDFSPGVVRPGALRITGALAEPAVARALRRSRSDLRRCVHEALPQGMPAFGELELALDVSGKGAVSDARLRSPSLPSLDDCVLAAARRWTLPAPADGEPARVVLSVRIETR